MYHQTYDQCEITESNILGALRSPTLGLRLSELKIPSSLEMSITAVQLTASYCWQHDKGDTMQKAQKQSSHFDQVQVPVGCSSYTKKFLDVINDFLDMFV